MPSALVPALRTLEGPLTILPSLGSIGPGFQSLRQFPGPRRKVLRRGALAKAPCGHTVCLGANARLAHRLPQRKTSLGEWTRSHWKTKMLQRVSANLGGSHTQTGDEVVAWKSSDVTEGRQGRPGCGEPRASLCACRAPLDECVGACAQASGAETRATRIHAVTLSRWQGPALWLGPRDGTAPGSWVSTGQVPPWPLSWLLAVTTVLALTVSGSPDPCRHLPTHLPVCLSLSEPPPFTRTPAALEEGPGYQNGYIMPPSAKTLFLNHHILRFWALGLQHTNFGGYMSTPAGRELPNPLERPAPTHQPHEPKSPRVVFGQGSLRSLPHSRLGRWGWRTGSVQHVGQSPHCSLSGGTPVVPNNFCSPQRTAAFELGAEPATSPRPAGELQLCGILPTMSPHLSPSRGRSLRM